MIDETKLTVAVKRLQEVQVRVEAGEFDAILGVLLSSKGEVLARFQPIFAPEYLPSLTEAEFRSFLLFKNNHHWSGLHRLGPRICADMDTLRSSLAVLLDENRPIEERYDYTIKRVSGMGRAVATAILLVMYPEKYGVWNSTSEGGLKAVAVDLWPRFERGEGEGSRYVKLNAIFAQLCQQLAVDLWTLDALWYCILAEVGVVESPEPEPPDEAPPVVERAAESQLFGLERHLHEFLRDNWDRTELGNEWKLHREPGNETAGYEYPCGVGRIDLLAHHRREPKWLVVELKRDQTGDCTLGQVMRYMGWVKRHLAEPGEEVRGLIVAHTPDTALAYAVSMAPTVDLHLYEVRFILRPAPEPEGAG